MSLQQPSRLERIDMAFTQKLRKWHFLFLGSSLILLSGYLWYWNWRRLGIPQPLRPEHYMTLASFVVGLFVLGIFVVRLTRRQVTIMLVGLILVNLVAALGTLWIYRTYPLFFDLLRPAELADYDPEYINNWRTLFMTPALYLMHGGLLLLWIESLVMFFVRKPTDQPE